MKLRPMQMRLYPLLEVKLKLLKMPKEMSARIISEAEGEASRFDQLLVGDSKSPEVTRQRLYLDAVQSVMNSSTKVMIDVKEGSNILCLPLDQIAAASLDPNRSSRDEASSSASTTLGSNIQEITDRVIEELRKEQDRR